MENNKKLIDKFKNQQTEIQKQVKEKMLGYMVAALGLVAGLAWNDAIKSLIEFLFPNQQNSLTAKFGYAVIITIVIVALTIILTKVFKKHNEDKN